MTESSPVLLPRLPERRLARPLEWASYRFGTRNRLAAETAATNAACVNELVNENTELRRRVRELEELPAIDAQSSLSIRCSSVPRRRLETASRPVWRSVDASTTSGLCGSETNSPFSCANGQESPRLNYLCASPFLLELKVAERKLMKLQPLDIEAELLSIKDSLQGSCMTVECKKATVAAVADAITEPGAWLHISAHSINGGSALVLEDETDPLGVHARPLAERGLRQLLEAGGLAQIDFLFLCVCQSEKLAKLFFDAGVNNVVFCPTGVLDSRARLFARSLYGALARRLSLEAAYSIAKCTAELSGDDAQYGLLTRNFGSSDLRIPGAPDRLSLPSLPQVSAANVWTRQHFKNRAEDFVGRVEPINKVLTYLGRLGRRLVLLHCEMSFGRSAMLQEIAYHITGPSRRFSSCDTSKMLSNLTRRCAFFPAEAPGGLLIVDDVDKLTEADRQRVWRHLAQDASGEAQLLIACRSGEDQPPLDLPSTHKPMYVELPPLNAEEAAELFLARCQRPLLYEDLVQPDALGNLNSKAIVRKNDAIKLLAKPVQVFKGIPGRVRKAVDDWARRGSPTLHGNLKRLAESLPPLRNESYDAERRWQV
eukprot:TRINITY_DN4217_c0_g2_i1.p1 TRINITY_DN4217_c0_g2~~TRINITY_DN4217_c0_g2_i1.p1  ORF type:complete len:599 (-),score=61.61 TRINITY_DN4217_c0_g2_i1:240-2036(-)